VRLGCYYVTAHNIKNLFSLPSDTVCNFQLCIQYELPNVFTPNGDGINDMFQAIQPFDFSGMFKIKIINRWGNLVFESQDAYFEWDGNHHTSKQPCPTGTYFYVAELIVRGPENLVKKTLSGSITLLR
jgi:gliding motility-associated-like protein